MIIVHHLNNSLSQRVLWLLEELGLEYKVKRYERDSKTMLNYLEAELGKSLWFAGDEFTQRMFR